MSHAARSRDIRYFEVMLVVRAILAAGRIAFEGKGDDKLQKIFNLYDSLVYPENAAETEDMAKRAGKILAKELAKGPLKVVAKDYGRKQHRRTKR